MPIHQVENPQKFLDLFVETTGYALPSLLADFVVEREVLGIALGGSIPLGIATAASDVDVLVLLESDQSFKPPPIGAKSVMFSGRCAGTDGIIVATVVLRVSGVEVDVQFLLASKLREILRMSKRSGIALTLEQRQIVGRLRTGWLLDRDAWPEEARDLFDDGFDIHCATHSLILSYRWLIDARVASTENWRLALHMGRLGVEKAFEAYFASLGYSSLGFKWLRFLDRRFENVTGDTRGRMSAELARRGQALLFPDGTADAVPDFLAAVQGFIDEVRTVMEEDLRYRLAFELSPHIAQPRVIDGTGRAG